MNNKLIFSIVIMLCSFSCIAQVTNVFATKKKLGGHFTLKEQKRLLYLYCSEEIDELTLIRQLPLHHSSETDNAFGQTSDIMSIIDENSSWDKERVVIFLYMYSSHSLNTFKKVYNSYLKQYKGGSLVFTTKYPKEIRNYILSFFDKGDINLVTYINSRNRNMTYSEYLEKIRFTIARNYRCKILKQLNNIHFSQ